MKITVIGIGQVMKGDDAAGLEAVRVWRQTFPETARKPEITVEASWLPGLNLLDMLAGAEAAILVDAVRSTAKPGTIHRLCPEQLAAFTGSGQSAHGWGVAETLALAEKLRLPVQSVDIRIIGIEAGQMDMGTDLTLEVKDAIPRACQAIEEIVQDLLK